MSLKVKVSLILLAVFAGLFAANALVLRVVLWPSFEAVELREAQQDVDRIHAALQAEADALYAAVRDWAIWDEAYQVDQGRNPRFTRHLIANTFDAYELDMHYLFDASGARIGGDARVTQGRPESIELDLIPPHLPTDHFLRSLMLGRSGVVGFVATERGPLLLAAHPVLTSNKSGSVKGLMVMGRFITGARIAAVAKRAAVKAELVPMPVGSPPAPGRPVLRFGDRHVDATMSVAALIGPPAMVLHAEIPRDITASGASAINHTLAALIITAGVVMLVILVAVQYLAVNPLARLAIHVRRLAETGDLAEHMHEDRDDEFGYLAREFNRMQWRISRLAFYDMLTELPNRYMFTEHMRRALSRAERSRRGIALFFLDLDGFRQVNDNLSHAVGDALLRQVAQRFRAHLRGCDIIARLGGDEFTVLVEDLGGDEAHIELIAGKILCLFDKPFSVGDHSVTITASIGVSLYPSSGATVDELLLAADIAMYHAKRGGPGRYHVYDEQDHSDLAPSSGVTIT